MRILKLHYPTGHPYWQSDEYKIELPNGEFYNTSKHQMDFGSGHRIIVKDDGIHHQLCHCGSGFGKIDAKSYPATLIVPKSDYDKIEFVGQKKEMSDDLKDDLKENGLS